MNHLETATFAGGCFWCLEAPLRKLKGVIDVTSGYMGGDVSNPDYKLVCTGTTGHAEVVQVIFDPDRIEYGILLEIFFFLHDPTTPDRQGNDVGTQYRSAVFYHTEAQRLVAEQTMARLEREGVWPGRFCTQVVPAETFYPAEEYHQRYFEKNPQQPYCVAMIGPKLKKLQLKFAAYLSPEN
jgi:peptide-methionine (S)-S-oxide reductase